MGQANPGTFLIANTTGNLSQRLPLAEATFKELRLQNKQLATEKWEIGQEKVVLAAQLKHLEASLE